MYLTEHELETIRAYFRTKPPVLKAWLFGSYARGEADAKSDVDLLVDLNLDGFQDGVLEFFVWRDDLAELLGKKVDVLSGVKPGSRFHTKIASDLQPIYELEQAA